MPPPDKLPQAYLAARAEADAARAQVEDLKTENTLLKLQLEKLRGQIYGGGKSEKFNHQQLPLAIKELEEALQRPEARVEKIAYERARPVPEKRRLPAELFKNVPVKETVVIEPEEVKACPENYEKIGEETTFEIDIAPPKIFKREIIRRKYRVKADRSQPPVVAPAPARAVAGGYASAGLLAWICIAKYLDHLPLYRLEQMSPRWGAPLSRQSMVDWIRLAADWLTPIYLHILNRLLKNGYIQVDETPVKCNDPDEKRGKVRQGYLWVVSRPGDDVVFDWSLSRGGKELTSLVKDFSGILQSDGYEVYAAHARDNPGVIWVGCWAHARRKFFEVQAENPKFTRIVLKLIARLYRCERLWDEADEKAGRARDVTERAKLREKHFALTLRRLHALALKGREHALPKSGVGLACGYLINQWAPLTAHVKTGVTRIDNNLVENAIRPSAIGKKNWLFIGHPGAGQRSAILYSLIVSCQRHGKDPLAYLRDVLTRLPRMTNQDDLEPLTPRMWKPEQTLPLEPILDVQAVPSI